MVDGLDLEVQAKLKAREQSFHAQWCFSGLHSVSGVSGRTPATLAIYPHTCDLLVFSGI